MWGVGVDLLEPTRLHERMTANPGLVSTLFTRDEQDYCQQQWDAAQHFAARFCAKEAVVKALRVDGWDPLEIEIRNGDPEPYVQLRGAIAEYAASLAVDIRLSMTHLESMAAAVAIAVPR